MANRLPADDEQEILDQSNDLTQEDPSDEDIAKELDQPEVDTRNPAAIKYFLNDKSENQPEGDQSKVGQIVGKQRDPFQAPDQLSPELNSKIALPFNLPEVNVDTPDKTIDAPKLSLLEQYKQLMQQKQDSNRNLGILQGANQISQAIASGYGAKISDGSDAVNQLRKNADQPLESFMGQGKVAELKSTLENNDANSDISKLARQQAVLVMQKLNPKMTQDDLDKLNKNFSNMSASELEKLGFKGISALNKSATNHAISPNRGMMTSDGHPIGTDVNPGTEGGRLVDLMTGRQIQPETKLINQVPKVDPITGQIIYVSPEIINKTSTSVVKSDGTIEFKPNVAQRKALETEGKQFDKQALVPMQQMRDAVTLAEELNSDNKMQLATVRERMGRIAKAGQAITVYDEQNMSGSQALLDKLNQQIQTWTDSTFTDDNRKQFADLLNTFNKQSTSAFQDVKDKFQNRMDLNYQIPKDFSSKYFGNKPSTVQQKEPSNKKTDDRIVQYAKDNNIDYAHAQTILKARGYNPDGQ